MACPGGCIAGGGQPRPQTPEILEKRQKALYNIDRGKELRLAHKNPVIKSLYEGYLEEPLSHKSHELLHTHYIKRGRF
ncbi:MAG: iron hydrogenase small subunit [Vulcanimicrobiota bacterium]